MIKIFISDLDGTLIHKARNHVKPNQANEKALKKLTAQKSFDFEIRTNISDKGTHQEFFWSQEFPRAVEWLYIDSLESPVKAKNELENQTND